MRRNDLRGEKECRGEECERRIRMLSRAAAWNSAGDRLVMISVFERDEGLMSEGTAERSRESGVLEPLEDRLEDRDKGGEISLSELNEIGDAGGEIV